MDEAKYLHCVLYTFTRLGELGITTLEELSLDIRPDLLRSSAGKHAGLSVLIQRRPAIK